MRRVAYVNGDRITVRLGPDESYRRLALLDYGAPLLVTRKAGDWFQVALESGRTGWMRGDFVALKGSAVAASRPETAPTRARHRHVAQRDDSQDDENDAPPTHVSHRTRHAKAVAKRHHARHVVRQDRESDDEDRPVRAHRRRMVNHVVKRHSVRQIADARRHPGRHSRRPEADAPETDAGVVRTAYAYRGVPYHFGGSSRNGFDCSGFTSYVYGKRGVHLPHSAAEQFGRGQKVHAGHLQPGDLVFFHTTRRGVSHVGIYAGNGKFVHASSGGGSVRVDSLQSGYYQKRLVGARRVK